MNSSQDTLREAVALLRKARGIVALTGAGISVASGIPDFRSPGGLWSKFDPQAVASVEALEDNPLGVWEFLLDAAKTMATAQPNAAHLALAGMEAEGRLLGIVTQNIDGLHQRAGSREVVEFHGGMGHYHCHTCGQEHDDARVLTLTREQLPWRCACGGLVRPDVVLFGEAIATQSMLRAQELVAAADVALIVGTSGEVAPASHLPLHLKAAGGKIVEINLGPTAFGPVSDVRLNARAEEVLPALVELLTGTGVA